MGIIPRRCLAHASVVARRVQGGRRDGRPGRNDRNDRADERHGHRRGRDNHRGAGRPGPPGRTRPGPGTAVPVQLPGPGRSAQGRRPDGRGSDLELPDDRPDHVGSRRHGHDPQHRVQPPARAGARPGRPRIRRRCEGRAGGVLGTLPGRADIQLQHGRGRDLAERRAAERPRLRSRRCALRAGALRHRGCAQVVLPERRGVRDGQRSGLQHQHGAPDGRLPQPAGQQQADDLPARAGGQRHHRDSGRRHQRDDPQRGHRRSVGDLRQEPRLLGARGATRRLHLPAHAGRRGANRGVPRRAGGLRVQPHLKPAGPE